jgi:hypothetical protein
MRATAAPGGPVSGRAPGRSARTAGRSARTTGGSARIARQTGRNAGQSGRTTRRPGRTTRRPGRTTRRPGRTTRRPGRTTRRSRCAAARPRRTTGPDVEADGPRRAAACSGPTAARSHPGAGKGARRRAARYRRRRQLHWAQPDRGARCSERIARRIRAVVCLRFSGSRCRQGHTHPCGRDSPRHNRAAGPRSLLDAVLAHDVAPLQRISKYAAQFLERLFTRPLRISYKK